MDKNNYSFTSYYIGANGDISYTVTTLDEDRRDRRMTIEELLEKIKQQGAILEELKKQVEELSQDEKKIRTLPVENEEYTHLREDLSMCSHQYIYGNNLQSIGNYFKSEEDAKMVIKAMQIEQAIRIRRIELNDGWEPDWDNRGEDKYFIFTECGCCLKVFKVNLYNHFPIFGYYKSEEIAQQVIDEFEDELYWYFTEYYPNKDKMYVWGD